ncbi:MAG: helix-hairpin-helix domain-containing protein [Fimbriimonadales bacterium]
MLELWEKLEPKEKLKLLAFYAMSLLLAGILGYGWGSGTQPVNANTSQLLPSWSEPANETPAHVETIDLSTPSPTETETAESTPTPETAETLVVHVSGAVRKSGVYQVPAGSRVADAVEQAGGATQNADLDALNLAEPINDGQKIYVPRKGEVPAPTLATSSKSSAPSGREIERSPIATPKFPININRASAEELEALPGIGATLARRIVEHRQQNGPFQSVDDLLEVRGIGSKKMEDIRPLITVR